MHNYKLDELKRRQQFFEEFGRYLPGSLCPAIVEQAVKFSVQPSEYKSNLPKLSLTEEELQQLQQKVAQSLDDVSKSKSDASQ